MQQFDLAARNSEPFTTLDECIESVGQVFERLKRLGQLRYPLAVRKGVKYMGDTKSTATRVRAGSRTYFFDMETSKEGKRYLKITESRYVGKDKPNERTAMFVFEDVLAEFVRVLADVARR